MVRGRVGDWERSALEMALEGVVSGQSLKEASRATGVPSSTIGLHLKRRGLVRVWVSRGGRPRGATPAVARG